MFIQAGKPGRWESTVNVNFDELWSGIREGNEEALSKLFCLFYSHLFNYGFKIVPQQALIKDSIQELFLTLWKKREQISEAHSVKSYLFHSLRRIILRNLTRQKNRSNRNRVYMDNFFEEIYNVEELIVHFETRREKRERLSRSLKLLSKRQKEAICLKFYNGLSNTEISHVMGINQQSVYNHVSKAIDKLQEFVQI